MNVKAEFRMPKEFQQETRRDSWLQSLHLRYQSMVKMENTGLTKYVERSRSEPLMFNIYITCI